MLFLLLPSHHGKHVAHSQYAICVRWDMHLESYDLQQRRLGAASMSAIERWLTFAYDDDPRGHHLNAIRTATRSSIPTRWHRSRLCRAYIYVLHDGHLIKSHRCTCQWSVTQPSFRFHFPIRLRVVQVALIKILWPLHFLHINQSEWCTKANLMSMWCLCLLSCHFRTINSNRTSSWLTMHRYHSFLYLRVYRCSKNSRHPNGALLFDV